MFSAIDIQKLAAMRGPERAFVSCYLAGPDSIKNLEQRVQRVEALLNGHGDELTHMRENMNLIRGVLDSTRFDARSMCIFACWANDFLQACHLEEKVDDLLWVDAAPYVRPLAALQDDYENFVVVAADNHEARVYFVTSSVPTEDERVRGDVKNRVKKGGWSQKRYARRRENELLHYAKDVVAVLEDLNQRHRFDRIIFVGSEEAMRAIREQLPNGLQEKLVDSKPLGLHDEEGMWDQIYEIFEAEERASEVALWERIRAAFMRGGRAVMGFDDVLKAAVMGRVEKMIVTRDTRKAGTSCRECENIAAGEVTLCPYCKSRDVFKVDLVEELVRILATTSAETEFTDPIEELTSVGDVAALLRY